MFIVLLMTNTNTAAALPTITTVKVVSFGRSGRRVAVKRGVSFAIELTFSNGAVRLMGDRFPAFFAAVSFGARVYKAADRVGMMAA